MSENLWFDFVCLSAAEIYRSFQWQDISIIIIYVFVNQLWPTILQMQ